MKAFITEYEKNCIFCGKPKTDIHHLCYGGANRKISDENNLIIPVCRECHKQIHRIGIAGKFSKIMGQLVYELNYVAKDKKEIKDAREKYRKLFGKSYL